MTLTWHNEEDKRGEWGLSKIDGSTGTGRYSKEHNNAYSYKGEEILVIHVLDGHGI